MKAASFKGSLPCVAGLCTRPINSLIMVHKRWAIMMDVGGGNREKIALWRRSAAHISHGTASRVLEEMSGEGLRGVVRCCDLVKVVIQGPCG